MSSLSKNLQLLKEAGFAVPDNALTYAKDQEYEQEGFAQLWKCKCGAEYKSPIKLLEYVHSCGRNAKKVWPRS